MDPLQNFHRLSSQIQILYNQSVITFLFPILAAPAIGVVLWKIADQTRLIGWIIAVILFSIARYFLIWKQKQEKITPQNVNKWLDLFTASVFISGLIWGSAAIILVPYNVERLIDFTIYNSLVMLIVCGLVAGAVIAYAVSKRVVLYYTFPALVPPGLYMIILGDTYNSTLGGFVLLYYLFITALSFKLNRQFSYYLDIEYQMVCLTEKHRALKLQYNQLRQTDVTNPGYRSAKVS